ncbi:lipase family protein, partial [Vibrio paucivorans]|nr:lipase [Vibrio paucivorans]
AQSPGMQDLIGTDLDAAQIAPPEYGGAYVHRGFYQYTMSLWNQMTLSLKDFQDRYVYICGHSLGGAGALLLSALINDKVNFLGLRLYSYGMPRAGTRSFVERYRDILHYRHVNNHDLVPQVPMTWVNTDLTESFEASDVFSSGVTLAKKMITDDDDDNYLHHGKLSQLITYVEPRQILLSPRQTQITMLDIAKMAENDSVALVDGLFDASIKDHGMEFYVPNLWSQLEALSEESLYQNYQGAISELNTKMLELKESYSLVQQEWVKVLGKSYSPVVEAEKRAIEKEKSVLEEQINNYQQVLSELNNILGNPERMPLSLLLLANQSLPTEVKEQIK